ncbi:harmonin isoform X2 [Coccinella septempunctata]|uniref:harmonin isoform X2 n=1 Tax=Coccinella septempunctata TaxID=41139 RepID=UPI001D08B5B7|nr:harmonin isoform X2 [Coccinella septempunctata]
MVVDYGSHPYATSSMSLETSSESCGSRTSRVRTIRLVRPSHGTLPPPSFTCRHGPSLGFSLRGGREHGTGFFVSYVEPASEAHRQGLKVGDQIIRVNGFTVEDAVHKEVLQLISNHTHLTLKVRRVSMIPVKEKKSDALSWQIITDTSSMRLSPFLEKMHDVRMTIAVSPRSKLGCGICKGPEWKPGIFVQFTKEGGIAREAGLRPGDQILVCNNVDFSDIPFNEAVNLMKMSRQLDLIVRKGAGSELFPGESSGYNSSASSVTGDQSPSWSDSKRLSIVKEENFDLEDRLDRLKCTSQWNNIEWDDLEEQEKPYFKPTIINLTENATIISNNGSDECQVIENDYGTIGRQKQELIPHGHDAQRTKTVVVDVHRSDVEDSSYGSENGLASSSNSVFSFGEAGSRNSLASCSLSSALSMEIQRRNEKKKLESKPSIDEQLQMKKIVDVFSPDKQSQHCKLMDEFKKAHKKMFKSSDEMTDDYEDCLVDRNASTEISQKLTERISNLQDGNQREQKSTLSRQTSSNSISSSPPPPPPLPIPESPSTAPATNGTSCNTLKSNKVQKPRAPPVPEKRSTLSFNQPPPCPTPDYDTLSIASSASIQKHNEPYRNGHADNVEMESLQSFELYSHTGNKPKPPDIYFSNTTSANGSISSGTSTLRKQRPVSVTIGEYGNGTMRKPGKLNFLQNGKDEVDERRRQTITSQFATELAQTLNRSNLKRRTESMTNCDK